MVLTTLQTHLTGAGTLNNHSSSTASASTSSVDGGQQSSSASMGVVCVQVLALLLSEDRLAEHLVPQLATVAALLVKVTQSSTACHHDCFCF